MKGYKDNIEQITLTNTDFRRVLYTGAHLQLVVMSLQPGEDIGAETHHDTDQFFRIDAGKGKVIIDGVEHEVNDGDAVVVPAGVLHNVINTSETDPLSLYTIYAPSHHKDGTIHHTKVEAEASHEHFDGMISES